MTTNQAKLNAMKAAGNAVRAWRQQGPIGSEMATLASCVTAYDQAVEETGAGPKLSAEESAVLSSSRDAARAWQASSICSSSQVDALEKACEAYAAATAPKGTEDLESAVLILKREVTELSAKVQTLEAAGKAS